MATEDRVLELAESFRSVGEILTAIGDETRQHIMIEMMKMGGVHRRSRRGDNGEDEPLTPGGIPPSPDSQECRDTEGEKRGYDELLLLRSRNEVA